MKNSGISIKAEMKSEHLVSIFILVVLFFYMYTLNYLMPLHRDDFEYALIWGSLARITTFSDILQSLYYHYIDHGGRMVAFFVLENFMLIGKSWFNPLNAALFVYLNVLIYWHSQRHITLRFNPYILGITIMFCWLGLPDFALATVWMTGSCVYLLTAVLILTFLLPYHFALINKPLFEDSNAASAAMFCGGIIAGWTIENTAATMVLQIGGITYYSYRHGHLKQWMLRGLSGAVLGYGLLIIAPGNYVRYGVGPGLFRHLVNQIGANIEIGLGLIPAALFLILTWRILVRDLASKKSVIPPLSTSPFKLPTILRLIAAGLMLISLLRQSMVSKWVANQLYLYVAIPFGIADEGLKAQLLTALSGLEEIILLLIVIFQIYTSATDRLGLSKSLLRKLPVKAGYKEVLHCYPQYRFAVLMVMLYFFNNLVMLAAPTFPGRAGFGSAVFFIIGALSVFRLPQVADQLLNNSRKKLAVTLAVGIILIPMAAAVMHQYIVLHQENSLRMAYVEKAISTGSKEIELAPFSPKDEVLRHVYFVDLTNFVSRDDFCRYYGLEDIRLIGIPNTP